MTMELTCHLLSRAVMSVIPALNTLSLTNLTFCRPWVTNPLRIDPVVRVMATACSAGLGKRFTIVFATLSPPDLVQAEKMLRIMLAPAVTDGSALDYSRSAITMGVSGRTVSGRYQAKAFLRSFFWVGVWGLAA